MSLRICSINIQGLTQNAAFLEQLVEDFDIICIQEHWLWSYETAEIRTRFPNMGIFPRSMDDNSMLLEHTHRVSAHGGIATMWNEKVSAMMKPMEEEAKGNCRLQVTKVDTQEAPICLINAYLASGTSKEAISSFSEDIDALHELLEKFSNTHEVVIVGDLNVDHHNRSNKKENLMVEFIQEHCLKDLGKQDKKFTYRAYKPPSEAPVKDRPYPSEELQDSF